MIKGMSKNEQIWVTIRPQDGTVWYITSKGDDRSSYYLYKQIGDGVEKMAKSRSPLDLEEKVWRC